MKGLLGKIAAVLSLASLKTVEREELPFTMTKGDYEFPTFDLNAPRRRSRLPGRKARQRLAYPQMVVMRRVKGADVNVSIAAHDRAVTERFNYAAMGHA